MVCDDLDKIPNEGEVVYLGKSIAHHYPSDVIACLCPESIANEVNNSDDSGYVADQYIKSLIK